MNRPAELHSAGGIDQGPFRGEHERQAVQDFWRVHEEHFDHIFSVAREQGRAVAGREPFAERLSEAQFVEESQLTRSLLAQAMAGDWLGYRARLEQHGARFAESGAVLHSSCEQTRFFMRQLVPHLVNRYAAEPSRLAGALQVMNQFADYCVDATVAGYVERIDSISRAREEDLATTLDSIGDAVIVTDAQGRIVRTNPVAERLTGFTFEDCRGLPLNEVFRIEHEDTGEPVESPVPRVLRDGVIVGLANHTVLIARDGTRYPIADSGAPVRRANGEIRGVVLVFRDVTEERRAEEALRHWERIFQHATWGVALATTHNVQFQAVNPAYAEMHGYRVEELVGKPVSTLWAEETLADMERHAQSTHEHGRLVVETTHLRKDGSRLPVEVVATTIKNAQGKVAWFVANVQDITERKRLHQSQVRAIELEADNRRIEEANRLKSEFLANMSHELRTPLNSIIGFAQLIHDEEVGAVAPRQKEFLGDILTSGLHLLRLINDVLDLAKVEAGKMEFRPEPTDLPLLINVVVQSLRAAALDKRIKVLVSADPRVDKVVLDPARFKQLLYNYLSNALKFTPEGGRVTVRLLAEGTSEFRLEVEDTGPGVPESERHRLFTPFQQLDGGATKRHGGTGLGLALTRRLAEAQGGSVGVAPAAERGSVFFAVLPRRPANYPESVGPPRADGRRATAVLVIENEEGERSQLVQMLHEAGYEVDAVSTSEAAESAVRARAYHAIVFNPLLPDAQHLQTVLQRARSDERAKDTRLVALTLVSDQSLAPGFPVSEQLNKPVDAMALLAALGHGDALAAHGTPVLVIDDDPGSLKLMQVTLAKLGYAAVCFSSATDALQFVERVRPIAIIIDLMMPNMDGFAFLERFRASPENRQVPVMIWTVKDLLPEEQKSLLGPAYAVVRKGAQKDSPLSAALEAFLPTLDPTPQR